MSSKQNNGFTLLELMMVVAIIGILTSSAIPAFSEYKLKAKLAESSTIFKAIIDNEKTYYIDNDSFIGTQSSIPLLSSSKGQPMKVNNSLSIKAEEISGWSELGLPTTGETYLHLKYIVDVGKTDASGSLLTDITKGYHNDLNKEISIYQGSEIDGIDDHCENGASYMVTFSDLGITADPNIDFLVVSASGNFTPPEESECTILARVVIVENGANFRESPTIRINVGE